jgi:hypothetical protein
MDNTTVTISAARGKTIYKSTGVDGSDYVVKGSDVNSQLKNKDVGGSRDNLSHSITSGSVPAGK